MGYADARQQQQTTDATHGSTLPRQNTRSRVMSRPCVPRHCSKLIPQTHRRLTQWGAIFVSDPKPNVTGGTSLASYLPFETILNCGRCGEASALGGWDVRYLAIYRKQASAIADAALESSGTPFVRPQAG